MKPSIFRIRGSSVYICLVILALDVHVYISLAILYWMKLALRSAGNDRRSHLEIMFLIIFLSLMIAEAVWRLVVAKC